MLEPVQLHPKHLEDYRGIVERKLLERVEAAAKSLKGARILHINSTAHGGGVAQILSAELPILQDLGLDVEWHVLKGGPDFFAVTKMIHNGLQGEVHHLTLDKWELYQNYNRRLSEHIDPQAWDFIVVHDPQPAAVLSYLKDNGKAKWIWRNHIDTRHAGANFMLRFNTYLRRYDGMIFTMKKYLFSGLVPRKLAIIPMAIDPLNPKNLPLEKSVANEKVRNAGVDVSKPLVVQVSRFDPWKDPLGVIEAWQIAKQKIPKLQLALVGESAADDPQGAEILKQVTQAAAELSDIFVLTNQADDVTVRAFYQVAAAVIQKSLREGFGLTVSEALWANAPVIGGRVGGIPLQIQDGQSGYLVDSVSETAERIVELIKDPLAAQQMGERGHAYVRRHFLLPRLIRDDLQFLLSLKN